MRKFFEEHEKTLLFYGFAGLISGLLGIYLYRIDGYPVTLQSTLIPEDADQMTKMLMMGAQMAAIALIFGGLGVFFSKKCGLWRPYDETSEKGRDMAIWTAIIWSVVTILADVIFFSECSPAIRQYYTTKPSISYIVGVVIYSCIVEEIILHLFLMSLLALIFKFIFDGKQEKFPSKWSLYLANAVVAIVYAALHIPETISIFGDTSILLLRCMLLNSGLSLILGDLYIRYGIRYAMYAHGGFHLALALICIAL